jgi:hypothetical protein
MTDYFYKFPDQATMLSALRPLGMTYTTDDVEMVSQGGHQFAAHEVGELPEAIGYHLNLRVVDPEFDVSSLAEFEVIPTNPRCIWA